MWSWADSIGRKGKLKTKQVKIRWAKPGQHPALLPGALAALRRELSGTPRSRKQQRQQKTPLMLSLSLLPVRNAKYRRFYRISGTLGL
jgi:hypothetical protein